MERIYWICSRIVEGILLLIIYVSLQMIWIGFYMGKQNIHINRVVLYWEIVSLIFTIGLALFMFVGMQVEDYRDSQFDVYRYDRLKKEYDRLYENHNQLLKRNAELKIDE